MAEIRLIGWRRAQKHGVYGFAAVELMPVGLRIFQIALLVGSNGPRVCLPVRLGFDGDGRQRRDREGRICYERILAWRSRQSEARFSTDVVELVRRSHPSDLDQG